MYSGWRNLERAYRPQTTLKDGVIGRVDLGDDVAPRTRRTGPMRDDPVPQSGAPVPVREHGMDVGLRGIRLCTNPIPG